MTRLLTHAQARRVYDRIGSLQDSQAWYEDRAVSALIDRGDFGRARAVVELGCGTGRHAARLLEKSLPADATYLGFDVSARMVELASRRLAPFAGRARVAHTDGALRLDAPDASFDRFFSTFVFDLLSEGDIAAALGEAHRLLADDGLLCLTSVAPGRTLGQRAVMGLITRVHAIHPVLIAGCRPIDLLPFLAGGRWRIEDQSTVAVLGICSQIVIARKLGAVKA